MEHVNISPETGRTIPRYSGAIPTTIDESLPNNFLEFQHVIPT